MRPSVFLLILLSSVAATASVARAQALAFERVGDRPLDADDLAFDGEGALWAIDTDVLRLPPGGSVWDVVATVSATSHILPLGPDTLLAGGHRVVRSTNGGLTWPMVHDEGEALFEAPASGVLLAGTRVGSGVAYSHDRGATWAAGKLDSGTWSPWAEAFAELPPGHPQAGRLVAACWGGLSYSDDGGRTWETSSLWEDGGRYHVFSVAVGVDGRIYAAVSEQGVAGTQIAVSTDGGATYDVAYGFGVSRGTQDRIFALPGGADPEVGAVVLVEQDGSVWRSDDAAVSWRQVGQVPFSYANSFQQDAALGPDGRLYVAGGKPGAEREWVFRTTEPAVTAAARVEVGPATDPVLVGPGGGAFPFAVAITNTTTLPLALEAWTAVEGPASAEPVLGPLALTLGPGQSVTRALVQQVPASAPAGAYVYSVRVGAYPGGVVSSASFTFHKQAGGARVAAAPGVGDWHAGRGYAVVREEAKDVRLSVSPNPARGQTQVTLSLPEHAVEGTVTLLDPLGRHVALLYQGPLGAGETVLLLSASGLPQGVYVVRAEVGGAAMARTITVLR